MCQTVSITCVTYNLSLVHSVQPAIMSFLSFLFFIFKMDHFNLFMTLMSNI